MGDPSLLLNADRSMSANKTKLRLTNLIICNKIELTKLRKRTNDVTLALHL